MDLQERQLKRQVKASVTRVWVQSLDDIEYLLHTIEAVLCMRGSPPEDMAKLQYLDKVYQDLRKRILGVGNDEIRRLTGMIDALGVGRKSGYEEVLYFPED